MSERDILEVLRIYRKRLREFKRQMKALGVKVKVTASFGIWTSVVEEERGEGHE